MGLSPARSSRRLSSIGVPLALIPLALMLLTLLVATDAALAQEAVSEPAIGIVEVDAVLPPNLPWDGASRSLALDPDSDDPWITPSEKTGLVASPSYDETVAWLQRLAVSTSELQMVSLGKSGEGRDIWMVIASSDRAFSPEKIRASRKPVVLVQAGIHSGEIDGKDAGMMLLRDIAARRTKSHLLDHVQWLFIPIFNVDGHERRSVHGRINQRGPAEMGWRTTARNLNLNRDYAKADTPEMRALLRALEAWQPDLYVDVHVTDGIDYQYDITWGYSGRQSASPNIADWLEKTLDPPVKKHLEALGHVPGYLVFAFDDMNPDAGLFRWTASDPRFSDGYGALRHLPTILVENHSLDSYDRRVLGTYGLIEAILETVGREASSLRAAVDADEARRPAKIATSWTVDREIPPVEVSFSGVAWEHQPSEISGGKKVVWSGKPEDKTLPQVSPTLAVNEVVLPEAYWIPAPWNEVIERLAVHGVRYEIVEEATTVEVEMYRVADAKLADAPFEGRARVQLDAPPTVEQRRETFPAGSARIPTDQPLGLLAALLLEPQAPDSFFQWGFFLEILSRTEYVEAYVMEPTAERMLAKSPELRAAFDKKLAAESEFAADPRQRLQWLYRHSPYFDSRWRLYPVAREMGEKTRIEAASGARSEGDSSPPPEDG